MTGFGKASAEVAGSQVSVEASSVNHRYLDANIRLPSEWMALEGPLREMLKKHFSRGKITVNVMRKRGDGGENTLQVDTALAEQYADAAKELGKMLGSYESLSLNTLAQFNGIFYHSEPEAALEEVLAALGPVVDDALGKLDAMRATEGAALGEDLLARLDALLAHVAAVEARLPELATLYTERLRERIAEIDVDSAVAEDRIAMEVAVLADKGDVTEEVVRLRTHLDHGRELLESSEPTGRQLNFLVQEIQREINTLGSKVRDTEVVRQVLDMKSELERIREQIQNIE